MPSLVTRWGGLQIGPGFDGECSAPTVVNRSGAVVGVYIDDTTPNIETWVAKAAAKYRDGVVFVAVAPGQAGLHYHPNPPVVSLFEAYPYGEGVDPAEFFPLPPKYEGWIVQWRWPGSVGTRPPTQWQRTRLLAQVFLRHPKYVFLY